MTEKAEKREREKKKGDLFTTRRPKLGWLEYFQKKSIPTISFCKYQYIMGFIHSFSCLPMHNLVLHVRIHHRAVMMHHIPPPILKLKHIGHVERPSIIHFKIGFHGDPSRLCEDSSPYITNLKVNILLPIKCKLPTLYHITIPKDESKLPILWLILNPTHTISTHWTATNIQGILKSYQPIKSSTASENKCFLKQ